MKPKVGMVEKQYKIDVKEEESVEENDPLLMVHNFLGELLKEKIISQKIRKEALNTKEELLLVAIPSLHAGVAHGKLLQSEWGTLKQKGYEFIFEYYEGENCYKEFQEWIKGILLGLSIGKNL